MGRSFVQGGENLLNFSSQGAKDAALIVGRSATRAVGAVVGGSIGALYEATGETLKGAFYGGVRCGRLTLGGTAAGVLSGRLPNTVNLITTVAVASMVVGAGAGALTSGFSKAVEGAKTGAAAGDQIASATFDKGMEVIGEIADQVGGSLTSAFSSIKNTIEAYTSQASSSTGQPAPTVRTQA